MRFIFAFYFLVFQAVLSVSAQEPAELAWAEFRRRVTAYHPLARQAELVGTQAEASLLRARGGFDVKLFGDHYAKNFNGTTYFQYTETGAKWPTWLGLEIKAQYNWVEGQYFNPENRIPDIGQASFGLNWTLGQGLFFDDRRAGLASARIGLRQASAERDGLINDLLFEAAKTYWSWVAIANQFKIYDEALRQARLRHIGTREIFLLGDRPGIDTIETYIQVQTREMDLFLARLEMQNAALALSNMLWDAAQNNVAVPNLPPPPEIKMPTSLEADRQDIIRQALSSHPALRLYRTKLDDLDVERRLKLEKRKPVLDLSYNVLGSGWTFFPTATENGLPGMVANDIKWGLTFSYPILNRKARGDYQITAVKIAQTELGLTQKGQEIQTKIEQYANALSNLTAQIDLAGAQLARYRTLLDAEIDRFNFGESSIFLINTREQRWLDAQIKYQKLLAEYQKTLAGLYWAMGTLETAAFD